jgi:hypothetical protein
VLISAVCPHPPLLVPEVACGAAPELDGLRAACVEDAPPKGCRRPGRNWQVLAGAARGGRFGAELLADDAPYGVGYLAAGRLRE